MSTLPQAVGHVIELYWRNWNKTVVTHPILYQGFVFTNQDVGGGGGGGGELNYGTKGARSNGLWFTCSNDFHIVLNHNVSWRNQNNEVCWPHSLWGKNEISSQWKGLQRWYGLRCAGTSDQAPYKCIHSLKMVNFMSITSLFLFLNRTCFLITIQ